jgi:hypothetical protein
VVNYADADGDPVVTYRMWDEGTAGTSGYFRKGSFAPFPAGHAIEVGSSLSDLTFTASGFTGVERLWIQAYDGVSMSAWALFEVTTVAPANAKPTVSATNITLQAGQAASLGQYLSYSNPNGKAAVSYRFSDGAAAADSGYLQAFGQRLAAGQPNQVETPFGLTGVDILAGQRAGTETFGAQAFDGEVWGEWTYFTLTTTADPNRAPSLTVTGRTVQQGSVSSVQNWFLYADADNDAAVTYRFWDGGEGASTGYFSVPGVSRAAAKQNIDVAAASLSQVTYTGASAPGTEVLWVQVYDGKAWSEWKSFNAITEAPVNRAPSVTVTDKSLQAGSASAVQNWLSYADADNDAAVTYRFWDGGEAATSGYFSVPGAGRAAAKQNIDVAASSLSQVTYTPGSVSGSEVLWVQVYDGKAWSEWKSFTATTVAPVNNAPTVTVTNKSLQGGDSASVHGWLTYADANGDAAVTYRFWDGGDGASSGYFSVPGASHAAANQNIDVAAANIGSVTYTAGSVGGTETLWVQAYDGKAWGTWRSFTATTVVPVNHAPTVTVIDRSVTTGAVALAQTWFTYADADANPAVTFRLWDGGDGAGSGYFSVPGNSHAPAKQNIDVAAADLSAVTYTGASSAGSEVLWVQVYDGAAWSPWVSFNATSIGPANQAPTVAVADKSVAARATVGVQNWFSYADVNGDAAVTYRLWDAGDGATSGYFSVPGTSHAPAKQNIDVSAANLGGVTYTGGSGGGAEVLWVQVYDGKDWSAWNSFTATTGAGNTGPAMSLTSGAPVVAAGRYVWAHQVLSYSDAQGDAAVAYRFWDDGVAASSGFFSSVFQNPFPTKQAVEISADYLQTVRINAGAAAGAETLWAQAYDGRDWGPWFSFSLTTITNQTPTVSVADKTLQPNQLTHFLSLVNYSDPENDTLKAVRIRDDGSANDGSYLSGLNGRYAAGQTHQISIVNSMEYANISLVGGSVAGSETMSMQVFDGTSWSAWDSFTVQTVIGGQSQMLV